MASNTNEEVFLVVRNLPKNYNICEVFDQITKRFSGNTQIIKGYRELTSSSGNSTVNVKVYLRSEGMLALCLDRAVTNALHILVTLSL